MVFRVQGAAEEVRAAWPRLVRRKAYLTTSGYLKTCISLHPLIICDLEHAAVDKLKA